MLTRRSCKIQEAQFQVSEEDEIPLPNKDEIRPAFFAHKINLLCDIWKRKYRKPHIDESDI